MSILVLSFSIWVFDDALDEQISLSFLQVFFSPSFLATVFANVWLQQRMETC